MSTKTALQAAHRARSKARAQLAKATEAYRRAAEISSTTEGEADRCEAACAAEIAAEAERLETSILSGSTVGLPTAADEKLLRALDRARHAAAIAAKARDAFAVIHAQRQAEAQATDEAVTAAVNARISQEVDSLSDAIIKRQAEVIALRENLIALERASPTAHHTIECSHKALEALGPPAPGTTSPYSQMSLESGPHQLRINEGAEAWRARIAALLKGDDDASAATESEAA
jgi:hypothetical protein